MAWQDDFLESLDDVLIESQKTNDLLVEIKDRINETFKLINYVIENKYGKPGQ